MKTIYVIHENNAWVEPLRLELKKLKLPYEEWFLHAGLLDLRKEPPEGVFYNRMSASSHTRGHRYGPEHTAAVLSWLQRHEKRVINGSRALSLEISKIDQYNALDMHGIRTPKTIAAIGKERIIEAARTIDLPLITKHNRAGKGLGVRLFKDQASLENYVNGNEFEPSIDGITLVQEYIQSPKPFITRVEFVGGKLLYAVEVDTSQGFELCPADACRIEDLTCPAEPSSQTVEGKAPMFRILENFSSNKKLTPWPNGLEFAADLIEQYKKVLRDNDIEIAGIEFILDGNGKPVTYDINTNTNYNSLAETSAGMFGMHAIASYLGEELDKLTQ